MRKFLLFLTVLLCVKGFSQPAISSFAPSSGPAGTPVTITGTNFSTTLSDNIVYFGAVRAAVTAASATSLTVTAPLGATYRPITVTINNLTAYSRVPFVLTFASGYTSFTDSMFAPKVDFPVGFTIVDLAANDFNSDGKTDMVVTGYSVSKVEIAVMKNTSTPKNFSFAFQADLALANNAPTSTPRIMAGDLDGDGKPDLVITNTATSTVSYFLNTSAVGGAISFSRTEQSIPSAPGIVRIADLDMDGKPDLVIHTPNASQLAILRNTSTPGNISFAAPQNFSTGSEVLNFDISDFDGNGAADIFVLTGNVSSALIWRNTSTPGNFSFTQSTYTRPGGNSIVACDLNNDGGADALFNSGIPSAVKGVLAAKNTSTVGNIAFAVLASYTADEQTAGFCVGDLDGDGKLDYAGKGATGNVMLIRNISTASVIDFDAVKMYNTGTFISSFIADFDNDGISDILLADLSGGGLAIMRNRAKETKINSFTPVNALPGDLITINGVNFTGATAVSFGGTLALSFTVVSDTKITAVAGAGSSGKVQVDGPLGTDALAGFTLVLPPTITSFSPSQGTTGSVITITGENFISTSGVQFGIASAGSFTVLSPTTMTATVAAGSSGSISITNLAGTVALSGFTFIPLPTITSFTPLSATTGVAVTINGTGFTDVTSVKFGNIAAASFSVLSSTTISAVVASGASGSIQLSTSWGGSASSSGFIFTPLPTIASFTPLTGVQGSTITISGTGFTNVNAVSFGGTLASSFTVLSSTQLRATVANGASGSISLTTAWQGTVTRSGFTFISPTNITSFTPLSATAGNTVTIAGSSFIGVTNVSFGGTNAFSYTVLSPTTLRAVVASGSSGDISVTGVAGTGALSGFTYNFPPPPVVTSFTPTQVITNSVVTITGSDLLATTAVSFGGTAAASFTVLSPTTLRAVVADGATGSVSVTTSGGTAVLSGLTFYPLPTIASFTPLSATVGTIVTIIGTNFSNVVRVNIGAGESYSFTIVSPTEIRATMGVGSGGEGNVWITTSLGQEVTVPGFTYLEQPIVYGFSPQVAPEGTVVSITGDRFFDISEVAFGGTPASSFTRVSETSIEATVANGSSGSVRIRTSFGGQGSHSGFTFIPRPAIASFTPLSATAGTSVIVTGTGFSNVSSVLFGGVPALSFSALSSTTLMAVPGSGSSGDITVTAAGGTTAFSGFIYVNPPPPVITSFGPTTGIENLAITINGTDFSGVSAVSFGGTAAASFGVVSPTNIRAVVAAGSYSGSVSVTSSGGTSSMSGFIFAPTPAIATFSPLSATTGMAVTITGTDFSIVNTVSFGGVPAATFTIVSPTTILATVAAGSSGTIRITTSWAQSATISGFDFIPPPTITSYSPNTAGSNTSILISGTNLYGLTGVSFGGVGAASFTSISSTAALAVVGAGASGNLSITTSWGGVATRGNFNYVPAPTIASFTPLTATAGTTVLITGTNLSAVTSVSFGGTLTGFTILSSTTLSAIISNGATGSLSVTSAGGNAALPGFTYVPPQVPVITSFSPLSATANSTVTITGTDLGGTTGVSFGGKVASSFTVISPTTLTAVVGYGNSGALSVTTYAGTATLAGFGYISGPTVTSLSPLSGTVGSSVTITGLNFNQVAANNIVYFGATRASVVSATTTSLAVLVPPGATYAPVTVLNAVNYLSAASNESFLPVFSSFKSSISQSDFAAKINFASGGVNPTDVLTGDLDGDGKPDLVIVNSDDNKVACLLNTSTGNNISFAAPVMFNANNIPYGGVLADMNGDGTLDLVLTKLTASNNVQILLNKSTIGNIVMGVATPYNGNLNISSGGNSPVIAAVGDLDGDGKLDIVTTNSTFNKISFFLNTGTPGGQLSFAAAGDINQTVANNYSFSVAVGDIDGDGKPDVAVTSQNDAVSLRVFRNISTIGNVSFETNINLSTGSYTWGVKMGDMDGDGKKDIVVTNFGSGTISILRNTSVAGAISFAAQANISTPTPSYEFSIADINGDGKPDLVVPNTTSSISIFQNKSTVGVIDLNTTFSMAAGTNPGSVTAADFNGDGRPDIIAANNITGGNNMALFRNTVNIPTITSFTPMSATTGIAVTITGTNFSGTTAVSFGGTAAASFTVLSSTTMTAVVAGGSSGSISITTLGGAAALSGFTYTTPVAVISSFSPLSGATGTAITINGSNLLGVTAVNFGGTAAASFTVLSSTCITAVVANGSSGSISITTAGGATAALSGFTYIVPPVISSFTPLSAATGATVTISGNNLSNITSVTFGGTAAASFTVLSSTTVTVVVGAGSSGSISITTSGGTVSLSGFTYIAPPVISSFTPLSAATGATISINGSDLSNITAISFGGTAAATFTVLSSTTVTAIVAGGSSGSVSITTLGGTTALSGFTYYAQPVISYFTPLSAGTGTMVTIHGTDLSNITSISFGGISAASFTALSSTTATAVVAAGSSGSISITTLGGTTALSGFTYVPPPAIGSFAPFSALPGDIITIEGTNLSGTNAISFGGTAAASFTVLSSTTITAVVGAGSTGSISLTTIGGAADIPGFIFALPPPPVISSFTPVSATAGDPVTITGMNLFAATNLDFGGLAAISFTTTSNTSALAIVAAGSSGSVHITTAGGTTALSGFTYIPSIPTITSFSPVSAKTGDVVTITGSKLSLTTGVSFGGTAAASFTVLSSTSINAVVATGASGSISLTTLGGEASLAGFTYLPPPAISSFTPLSAATGATVTINGTNLSNISAVTFGGTPAASFTSLSSTTITAVVAAGSSGSISITTAGGTTALSGFTYILPPVISSFTPLSAATGATVTINGTNLSNVTSVNFGGTAAASFTVLSSTAISAVVAGGSTGSISITTLSGTANRAGFTYIPPPAISSFTPLSAATGATVTINGTNLSNIMSVNFGGTAATSFTVLSSTTITAIVAAGSSGNISVTTAGGTMALPGFIYIAPPVISSFTPQSGATGATIVLNGSNLSNITSVSFGGTAAASFTVLSSTRATAVVATGSSGSISITTVGGTVALSGFTYLAAPVISSFAPLSATTGSTITIYGSNLSNITAVSFGGTAASSFTVLSSTMATVVVGPGATGNVGVTTPGGSATLAGFIYYTPAVPAITSFAPSSALTGTSVVISGANFNVTAGNNIVFFGATQATVTAATTNSLTVTVPAGATYAPITVLDKTTYRATASRSNFTPLFSPQTDTIVAAGFSSRTNISTGGNNPTNVLAGDLDGDGKTDLSIINSDASTITFLRNTSIAGGPITFAAAGIISSVTNPFAGSLGDLDGDGKLDLAVAELNDNNINILLNKSTPGNIVIGPATYGAGLSGNMLVNSLGTRPTAVAIADLDEDGKPDLIITNTNSNTISILRNTGIPGGQLSFAIGTDISSGSIAGPITVQVGDLDGDGKPDLAIGYQFNSTSISVLRNTSTFGTISFAAKTDIAAGTSPWGLMMGDLDGDGKPDLAVANYTSNTISLYRNTSSVGAITFAAKTDMATINPSYTFAMTDMDGDGKPDITVANYTANTLSVFHNNSITGAIAFGTGVTILAGNSPGSVTAADLNGDGKADLAVANRRPGDNNISIFTNLSGVPTIASFTPLSATTGTTITIKGSNFSGTTAVTLGGTNAASFTVLSSTTITAVVGAGASGSISITTSGGNAARTGFTYVPTPSISSFVPMSATSGTTITITGQNLLGISSVSFGATAATSFTVLSSTTLTAVVGSGSSGSVYITSTGGTAGMSGFTYYITVPVISSFAPLTGTSGDIITITGTDLSNSSAVSFGGTAAASFTVLSSTTIKAVVGSGTSGNINVTTPGGSGSMAGFTFVLAQPPVITSFSPVSAGTGGTIMISGSNLFAATAISFGGTPAASFTVLSSTTIAAVVASGTSGSVSVTTTAGTTGMPGFNYLPPPAIISFTPMSAATGETVTITGSNLSDIKSVSFGGTLAASFTSVSENTATAVVGGGASGSIRITSTGGTVAMSGFVYVSNCDPQTISFTPQLNNLSNSVVCFRDNYTLSVSNSAVVYPIYKWSTGETTKDLLVEESKSVSLRVGLTEGCLSNPSNTVSLVKNTNPVPTLSVSNDLTLTSSTAANYRWYYNNSLLSNETVATLTPTKIGFYKVETSADMTCWDATNDFPVLFLPTPILSEEIKTSAYPNPATGGTFTIVATLKRATNVIVKITVTTSTGVVVLQTNRIIFFGKEVKIPLTVTVKGTLFVKIDINGDVQTQTVIVP